MVYSESQLLNQLDNCNRRIKDHISQLIEYNKSQSILNIENINEIASNILNVDTPKIMQICEHTKNIIEELQKLLQEETKRRNYSSLLEEINKKGKVRKHLQETRKERIKQRSNPYNLRKQSSQNSIEDN